MKGEAGFPVRLQYTKRGKVRWISHRDVARAMERAFRITELPLAFTAGFSPRPKVSFGLALSTGHESDAEYLDLEFAHEITCDALCPRLTAALPEGIEVVAAAPLVSRAPALQEAVTAVDWKVELVGRDHEVIPAVAFERCLDAAMARDTWPTTRRRKGREVTEDVRPVVRRLDVQRRGMNEGDMNGGNATELLMELSTQPRSAKPGEILAAIARAAGASDEFVDARALRTHQWIERDGTRLEPQDADTRRLAPEARAS